MNVSATPAKHNAGANSDFAIVRYNQDGSADASFGSGGEVVRGAGFQRQFGVWRGEDVAGRLAEHDFRSLVGNQLLLKLQRLRRGAEADRR